MRVIEIEKDKKGYRITFENGEICFFTEEGFYHLGVREGDEIKDVDHFKRALEKDRFRLLKYKAMSYLGPGSKTKQQVGMKFKKEGYSLDEIDKLIVFLEEYGLINESAYLERSIKKLHKKGASRVKAQQALHQKGFEGKLIKAYLEGWSGEMEEEHALQMARKKWGSIKDKSKEKKTEKLIRFLSSQGFQWNTIAAALRAIASEEGHEFCEEG